MKEAFNPVFTGRSHAQRIAIEQVLPLFSEMSESEHSRPLSGIFILEKLF
jgi:hypothetical protein